MLDISTFVIKFFKEELDLQETKGEEIMDLGDLDDIKETIERILLMNLN
jgi:hypothetical protein